MEIKNYKNIVNGVWKESSDVLKVYSPINGEQIATTPAMSREDIDEVMLGAKNAQPTWNAVPLREKKAILYKTADLLEARASEIAEVMMWEVAKSANDSRTEVLRTAELIRYTADIGVEQSGEILYGGSFAAGSENKRAYVERVPMGVVLAIAPFNYPVNLTASKIAPALIAGNSVVVKGASQGTMSALELIKAFIDAGVPAGVLNSVSGRGSIIGDYIVEHPAVNFINFTGSTGIGEHIGKLAGMKPLLFELGGKDAALVLADSDLANAATEIVAGGYSYSGQRCTAIKRVLVDETVADELAELIKIEVEKLSVGMPADNPVITPTINQPTVDNAKKLYDDAIAKGATGLVPFKNEGNLMYPTLVDHVTVAMELAWEEPFAPIMPIIRVKTVEEMIKIANDSEYGLQSSVFSANQRLAEEIAQKLEVGTVHINTRTQRGPDNFPFLGIKGSGVGVQGIKYSIESMTRIRSTVVTV